MSAVAITSDAGDDDTYALGDTIQITLTFSEAVDVTGTPQLAIDMDPADWGTKQAAYESGSGSASLVFAHKVVEPNLSTQGIAVLENTLALNGGSIQSASSQIDASLSHAGLGHDPSHKVDWQTEPNHAPVINTQAEHYADFTGSRNAPRGTLVWKRFQDIFSDPDGDELTYSASVPAGQSHLVEMLETHSDLTTNSGEQMDFLFFRAEAEADWKAMNPQPPVRPVVTVTLTATDPGGLSASVDGDFLIHWETYPELQSAVASQQAITLTYDMAMLDAPAPTPGQFTVNVANSDGTAGTIAVSSVTVNGTVVTLELGSELEAGQTVTFGYANATDTPLRAANGWRDPAPWFRDHAVDTSQLGLPGAVANFSVSAERGKLDLWAEWDAVAGATSYQLRWRKVGGEFEAADTLTATDSSATITVSDYGQWEVQAQACNDAGCSSADEAPAVRLSMEPAQGAAGQSRARSLTTTSPPVEDERSYTVGWGSTGADAQGSSQPDADRQPDATGGPSGAGVRGAVDQADTTPPRLVSGEIDGDVMTFYFSEPLDENKTESRFRVTLYFWNGWANFTANPRKVEVSGNNVTVFGLSRDGWPGFERAQAGQRVQVYYYKNRVAPASERLRDLAGNEVATTHRSLGGHFAATRSIWLRNLTAPPALQSATAYPRWLSLTFDDRLYEKSVPPASAFTVTVNGSAVSLASANPVAVSGDTVTLVLAAPLASTDTVTVSYAKPSGSKLRGLVGEPPGSKLKLRGPDGEAKNFSGRAVTNRVGAEPSVSSVAITSTPADGEAYAPGETVRVSFTFTEAVAVTGAPRLRIKLAPNYGRKWADYNASASGATTLAFDYTVVEPDRSTRGVAVLRDTLDRNGGAIRSATTQTDAHLWYGGLDHDASHMVDWHRSAPGVPWVTGVAITSDPGDDVYAYGETIQVTATFSEAVNVDTTGGTPRLRISMAPHVWQYSADPEKQASYVSGSGTPELAFEYTVAEHDRSPLSVGVVKSGLELNGGTITSTGTTPVNAHVRYGGLRHDQNHFVDGTAPALLSVAVSGDKVSVAYGEALDVASVPPVSAFTVKRTPQGGAEETVSLSGWPTIAAGAVLLTLADPVLATDTDVKVSYTKPASASANKLKDKAGNEAASFTDQATDATDTTQPRLARARSTAIP